MINTGTAFAVPNFVQQAGSGPPTSFLVIYETVITDGVSASYQTCGNFTYDSTQPVATNVSAFKASVAAAALEQFGLTIPVANILVVMGVN